MPSKPKQPSARRTPARFAPVPTRKRHDGWTPERQTAFIEALAASACVEEACRTVGLSTASAYRLRARLDAQSFRLAWDSALDFAVRRLGDAVLARALYGTPVPHYYQGEQVGEHRRYDNRLAQFVLRYRDPLRYAATLDHMVYSGHPETAAVRLARHSARVAAGSAGFTADAAADLPWDSEPVPDAAAIRAAIAEEQAAEARARAGQPSGVEELMADFSRLTAERKLKEHGVGTGADLPQSPSAGATGDAGQPGRGNPRVTWR